MKLFAGERVVPELPQQQMVETASSYSWEFWLAAAGVLAAIVSAAVPAIALYLKYRRKKKSR